MTLSQARSGDIMVITKTEETLAITIMMQTKIMRKILLRCGSIVPTSHSEKYSTIIKTKSIVTLECAMNKASPIGVVLKAMTPNNHLKNLSSISCDSLNQFTSFSLKHQSKMHVRIEHRNLK